MKDTHKLACARSIRQRGLGAGWTERRIAREIHEHCHFGLLRAHRLARGWTLDDVAIELRAVCADAGQPDVAVSHQRVSRWESGADVPSPRYLDALCRLYRSRPDLLGFGNDYGDEPIPATHDAPDTSRPAFAMGDAAGRPRRPWLTSGTGAGQPPEQDGGGSFPEGVGEPDDVEKASLLFHQLREARTRADALLETQSVCSTTVERWEALAEEYGCRQLTTPLDVFLSEAIRDFSRLQDILSQRQPLEFQQRLYRVMAQLAGLIGFDAMGIGSLRESHAWNHTAQLAAEETGDRQLRAWLIACKSLSYFWDTSLVERAVTLCASARAMAGASPTTAGALAASIQARAMARLGRRREALEAMRSAEVTFERLPARETGGTRLGFYERRLRYDQENVLTRLGETREAMKIQRYALELPHGEDIVESTMLGLDWASCLVTDDELEEGCRVASRILREAPHGFVRGVVLFRAREIDKISRSRDNRLAIVDDLHETLRAATV